MTLSSELARADDVIEQRGVRFWHLADKRPQPLNGRYWTNSGQRPARALNGSVANDPGCVKTPRLM